MTNEQYIVVSYFTAVGGGIVLAIVTAMIMRGPLRRAVGGVLSPLGRLMRRVLPAWLVLFVLLAFTMVSYFDCSHHSYQDIVKDRPHMINVTRTQSQYMLICLGLALLTYVLVLAVVLIIRPRVDESKQGAAG
ncbi:MAG: hypothetical protein SVT52_02090 [Planctomycetota bacterium]|nr:hypothetical protein [Planctomycetota bacterium]